MPGHAVNPSNAASLPEAQVMPALPRLAKQPMLAVSPDGGQLPSLHQTRPCNTLQKLFNCRKPSPGPCALPAEHCKEARHQAREDWLWIWLLCQGRAGTAGHEVNAPLPTIVPAASRHVPEGFPQALAYTEQLPQPRGRAWTGCIAMAGKAASVRATFLLMKLLSLALAQTTLAQSQQEPALAGGLPPVRRPRQHWLLCCSEQSSQC